MIIASAQLLKYTLALEGIKSTKKYSLILNSRSLNPRLILVLVTTTSAIIIGQAAGAGAIAEPPVPDDCKARPFEDGLALDCTLSAINSAEEKTNFSVLPAQHTRGLTVRCSDPALSQLEPDGLRRFVLFHTLSDYPYLANIQYLQSSRTLNVLK